VVRARGARQRTWQRCELLFLAPAAEEPSPAAESRREILGYELRSAVIGGATVRARTGRTCASRTCGIGARITGPRAGRARQTARRCPGVTRARRTSRLPARVTTARLPVRVTSARLTVRLPARVTCAALTAWRSSGAATGAALARQTGWQRSAQPTGQRTTQAAQGTGKPAGTTQATGTAEAG